jgi:hypothetical protein
VCIFSPSCFAGELTYNFLSPGYKDDRHLECDKYVRNNYKTHLQDMEKLIEASISQNWPLTDQLISKYNTDEGFIKNTYTQAVYDCGAGYIFSDGNNYYRNLYRDIFLLVMALKESTDSNKRCSPSAKDLLAKIKKTTSLIIGSTNKAANKSSNLTGAQNAPPS